MVVRIVQNYGFIMYTQSQDSTCSADLCIYNEAVICSARVTPSQAPRQGVVRSQDSTERSWIKVSRFRYSLMEYSCYRQQHEIALARLKPTYLGKHTQSCSNSDF